MVPYVALYTHKIQILGETQVQAYSVEQAIQLGRELVRTRKIQFRLGNTKFGNVRVDEDILNFFVSNLEENLYQVSITATVTATARVTVTAASPGMALEALKFTDVVFRFNQIPIPELSSQDVDSFTLTETVRPNPEFSILSMATTAGAGVTVTAQIQSPKGSIEVYLNNEFVRTYEAASTASHSILLATTISGNNYYQFRYIGNETYAGKTVERNLYGVGFPSEISYEGTISSNYYLGDRIPLVVTVQNDSEWDPTGTIKFKSGTWTQSSEPLKPEPDVVVGSETGKVYFEISPPLGTYTSILSYSGDEFLASSQTTLPSFTVSRVPMEFDPGYVVTPNPPLLGGLVQLSGTLSSVDGVDAASAGQIVATVGDKVFYGYCDQGTDSESLDWYVNIGPVPDGSSDVNLVFIPAGLRWTGDTKTITISTDVTLPVFIAAEAVSSGGGVSVWTVSNTTSDVLAYVNGIQRVTNWVSSTILEVTIPALTSGSYSVELVQSSGSSGVIPNGQVVLALPVSNTVTDIPDTGGVVTVSGSHFSPDAAVWTDGVQRVTTYVNSSTLTATVPAHAAGVVSLYVVQASGTSNTISLTYIQTFIDLDARSASLFFLGDDYNPATPDKWFGHPSAGNSGDAVYQRTLYQAATSSATGAGTNPTTITVNGHKWVQGAGDSAGPLFNLSGSQVLTFNNRFGSTAWSMTIAGRVDVRFGSATHAHQSTYLIGAFNYGGIFVGGSNNPTPDSGLRLGYLNVNQSQWNPINLPGEADPAELFIAQAQFNAATSTLRFRVGKGAWTSVAYIGTAGSPDVICLLAACQWASSMHGAIGGIFVEQSYAADMDAVYDSLANRVGIPPVGFEAIPWTDYHEQGLSTPTNYNPANASPWAGAPTTGPTRDLVPFGSGPWTLPSVGPAIGTTTSVDFNDDLDDLRSQLTAEKFVSLTEFTLAFCIKVEPTAQTLATNACIAYLNRIRIYCGQVGGVSQCKMQTISTIDNYADSQTFATNTWVTIFARFGGGQLDFRVNKTNSTPVAGIAPISTNIASDTPRVAHQTTGTTLHKRYAHGIVARRLTDAECDVVHNRWKSNRPELGLV